MDPLSLAASLASMNYAGLGAATLAAAVDPTPGTVSTMDQAGVQSSASIDVLRLALQSDASMGSQLAQMMGLGQGVDVTA